MRIQHDGLSLADRRVARDTAHLLAILAAKSKPVVRPKPTSQSDRPRSTHSRPPPPPSPRTSPRSPVRNVTGSSSSGLLQIEPDPVVATTAGLGRNGEVDPI